MTLFAFLCPDLVKAALEGRLPCGFGVRRLTDWSKQWSALGLNRDALHDALANIAVPASEA
jgi:hypothetical protein